MGHSRAIVAVLVCTFVYVVAELHPLSDEFIDLINSKQTTWKAGRNFPPHTPIEHLKRLLGVDPNYNVKNLPIIKHNAKLFPNLPKSFDPRDKWPQCPSLFQVRDQGSCGSCWAFAAVTAMTDRVCIYSDGEKQFYFSAEDLVTCCSECGEGCQGGSPATPWEYWVSDGIVSGGDYNSNKYCRPYSFPTCEHHEPGYKGNSTNNGTIPCIDHELVATPKCSNTCIDGYGVSYNKDKQYGEYAYAILDGEEHIKAELFKNGPVEGGFRVFNDFFSYKSGVYQHTAGEFAYGHAVKIMGWGVENGTKYWLVANSFNSSWGDKGFFKILRGEDHCGIETYAVAGEPMLNV